VGDDTYGVLTKFHVKHTGGDSFQTEYACCMPDHKVGMYS
jgi:hypothetical protein